MLGPYKLLKLLVTGQHLPYCQTASLPALSCTCLSFEAKKWIAKKEAARKPRVAKKPRGKIHCTTVKCGAKHRARESAITTEITCRNCLKKI
jgi:hypothetical protein